MVTATLRHLMGRCGADEAVTWPVEVWNEPNLPGFWKDADPEEKLFGMGQYQQELLDVKNCVLELAHRNSQASVPFVLSDKGYGFFWHNPAVGRAIFGKNLTQWYAESTDQMDYWVTAGDTPDEIERAYARMTGTVPMMPEYGMGFWQCKLRYWNQEQPLNVAREYHRRGIPVDVIVVDFYHWPKCGDFRFDEADFPDPKAMVEELKEYGMEVHFYIFCKEPIQLQIIWNKLWYIFWNISIISKQHNKFLFSARAGAKSGSFCEAGNEISNVVYYEMLRQKAGLKNGSGKEEER